MTPTDFYPRILIPAAQFAASIEPRLDSPEARCQMLATAGQETQWAARRQVGGPARGFWQAEPNGVLAVLMNAETCPLLTTAAHALRIATDRASIYTAIEFNDPLAYMVARLLLWALPDALPALGDEDMAWAQYVAAQRPGKPDRARWAEVYPQCVAAVRS